MEKTSKQKHSNEFDSMLRSLPDDKLKDFYDLVMWAIDNRRLCSENTTNTTAEEDFKDWLSYKETAATV